MTIKDCANLALTLKTPQVAQTLKTLVIQSSKMCDDCARLIADAMIDNKCLTSLDLSHNNIGDSGARGFAKVLSSKSKLKKLILANNRISRDGAYAIGKALAGYTKDEKPKTGGKKLYGCNQSLEILNIKQDW